jgi:hypothetical protein
VSKTPKVVAGPIPADYADRPENERLPIAADLASTIAGALRPG